ncbi:hypothetical protein FocTR4_00006550, partial [Fusarium oxysporum f. sp. cubense]
ASAIVHCRRQSAFGWTKDSGAGEAMLSLAVICNEASTQATLASHGCTRDAHGGQATGGIRTDRYSGGKHIPEMIRASQAMYCTYMCMYVVPNATIAHVSYEGPSVNTRHASCWKRVCLPTPLFAYSTAADGFPQLVGMYSYIQ